MGFLVWNALRQIQGTMDSVRWMYDEHFFVKSQQKGIFKTERRASDKEIKIYNEILTKNNLGDFQIHGDQIDLKLQLGFWNVYDTYQRNLFPEYHDLESKARHINISQWDESIVPKDFAYEITAGEGGWTDVIYQINCLAMIRLFGSYEQFEIKLLKALFYYRPNRQELFPIESLEMMKTEVDPRVILEEPTKENDKDVYQNPPIWTWIVDHVNRGLDERNKIFKNVFALKIIPDEYKPKVIREWQEKRNAIAHGKRKVEITLKEIFDFSIFCKRTIINAEKICLERLKLII